jgi:DNA primase
VHPQTFTISNMERRIADVGDLWGELNRRKRPLKRAVAKLKSLARREGR